MDETAGGTCSSAVTGVRTSCFKIPAGVGGMPPVAGHSPDDELLSPARSGSSTAYQLRQFDHVEGISCRDAEWPLDLSTAVVLGLEHCSVRNVVDIRQKIRPAVCLRAFRITGVDLGWRWRSSGMLSSALPGPPTIRPEA